MSFSTRFAHTGFTALLCTAFLGVGLLGACAPRDEKVSTRGGNNNSSQGSDDVVRDPDDYSDDFSRALLVQVSDVARQAETAMKHLTKGSTVSAANLKLNKCGKFEKLEWPATTPMAGFNITSTKCVEAGMFFKATANGTESYSVVYGADSDVPAEVIVESEDMTLDLIPIANNKDSLKITTIRKVKATLQKQEGSLLTYTFRYKANSQYSANMKAFFDDGKIDTAISGYFTYDKDAAKLVAFTTEQNFGVAEMLVQTARRARSSSRFVARDFRIAAKPAQLAFNMEDCSMPTGEFESKFAVGANLDMTGGKENPKEKSLKKVVKNFKSGPGLQPSEATEGGGTISGKVCSADNQVSYELMFRGLVF